MFLLVRTFAGGKLGYSPLLTLITIFEAKDSFKLLLILCIVFGSFSFGIVLKHYNDM